MDTIERAAPRITTPGAYDDIANELYHSATLTPSPALSSGGARMLVGECPAMFHYRYLDPTRPPENKRAFDIGGALHLLTLEPHLFDARVFVIDADDYRTKGAQEAKQRAYLNRRIPLLEHEAGTIRAMRDAIMAHPVAGKAFSGGVAERTYAWRDPATGIWCKARPDYTPDHLRYFVDVKSSTSANPAAFAKRVWDLGYHQQAAWYLDARHAVDGIRPERFAFVVVAKEAPHLVSVCWLDEETLAWGALQNERARRIFADCLASSVWPGYREPDKTETDSAFTVSLPPWAKADLQRQHEAGRFTADHVERAQAAGVSPFV